MNFAKNEGGTLEVLDTNNYYAFGMNHIGGIKSLLGEYKNYKYNGKELQETGMYDYGARMYMADIERWGVVDPLAEKYRRHSPYNYTVNNPIRFIDPDGRGVNDVIINGAGSQAALQELQKSVSSELTLSMNSNGKVSYTQNNINATLSEGALKLTNAINDHSVIVNVDATTDRSLATSGDSFMGNKVSQSISSELSGNTTKLTIANQTLNPEISKTADDFYDKPGANTLHAVTEAYEGAKISQANGYSAGPAVIGPDGKVNNPVYHDAHNNLATPQSGPITAGFVDSSGNILPNNRGADHMSIFVHKPDDALEINSIPIK